MRTVKLRRPKSLSNREWYSVLIASHLTTGNRKLVLTVIQEGIGREKLPELLFSELFLHLSLLLGYPTMLDCFQMLRTIAPNSVIPSSKQENASVIVTRGRNSLRRVYGEALPRLLVNLRSLHPIAPEMIVRDAYGRIISRAGLSLREREIVNVVVLSIQGLYGQLYSHLRGALREGVSSKTLRDTINSAARIAGTDLRQSLMLLSSLAGPRRKLR